MVFNIVMYVMIIRALIRHTISKNKRMSKSSLTVSVAMKMLVSYSGIMVLFGLTWLFAAFAFITEPSVSFVIQFFFAVFNAFQGFLIFLFFVLLSGDSRDAWKSVLCLWGRKDKKNLTRTTGSTAKSSNVSSLSVKSKAPVHDYNKKEKRIATDFNEGIIIENDMISEGNVDEFMMSEFNGTHNDEVPSKEN